MTATTGASAADGATNDDDANLLVDFKVPGAGMFLWLRLRDVDDAHTLVTVDAVAAGVLMVPGYAFFASLSHGGGGAGPLAAVQPRVRASAFRPRLRERGSAASSPPSCSASMALASCMTQRASGPKPNCCQV